MKFREYVKKQQSKEFWKFFKSKVTDDYNCTELSYNKNVTENIFGILNIYRIILTLHMK